MTQKITIILVKMALQVSARPEKLFQPARTETAHTETQMQPLSEGIGIRLGINQINQSECSFFD